MITSIDIPHKPPYDGEAVSISGLKRVNFFFGSNGTGKTSLCRLINSECEDATSEHITWEHDAPVTTYVFSKDFVERNFRDYGNVPGVFTMGAESVSAQDEIDEINAELAKQKDSLKRIHDNLEIAKDDAKSIEKKLEDECWSIKSSLHPSLKRAYKGSGNSKAKFCERALREFGARRGSGINIDSNELVERMATLFDSEPSRVDSIPHIDAGSLAELEAAPILSTPIVGKEGLGISALIDRLKSGDWVGRGRVYLRSADGKCPFCQQPLPVGFEDEIEQFFDDSYQNNLAELARLKSLYENQSERVINTIDGLFGDFDAFVDAPALKANLEELRRLVSENLGKLNDKVDSPGLAISLKTTVDVLGAILELLGSANKKIESHNALVDNLNAEREKALSDAWDYISAQLKSSVSTLLDNKGQNDKKLNGLSQSEQDTKQRISELESKLHETERKITSVQDTAGHINEMLRRFGFDRFSVGVDKDRKRYRIARPNGDPAGATLSEGERSFLTFLYFYYLMRGSQTESGTTEKRVVVIDDPISSVDSDVLFITSSLVRNMAMEAREESGHIIQLFVLTHNISFFREVTFIRAREGEKSTSYYTIRKTERGSIINKNETNPVSSTYEMLWRNLFEESCSSLTAQNVSRRIVENFFRFIGNTKTDEIPDGLTGDERTVARAFLLWANSGSHNAFEDETDFNPNLSVDSYRKILHLIFEKHGYSDHYDAMVDRHSHGHR